MADTTTGLHVKSLAGEFVRSKIVDTAGTNEGAVSAAGRLSVDGSGVTQPVSIAGTVTVDTELTAVAALADAVANPTITNIASYLVGYNGSTWDRVRTANTGRLQVDVITGGGSNASVLVDNAGFTDGTSSVTTVGYIFDDVAGVALTENDVAAARIDSKRAVVFVGEDATTRTQKWAISAAGALASNITQVGGATISATVPLSSRLTDGTAFYTKTGQLATTAAFAQLSDQTTAVGVIAGTTALKTDLSSVAGTATVTGGISGVAAIGGPVAADAVVSTNNPLILGARVSAAAQADVSADNDVAYLWALRNGSLVVNVASGGTLWTNQGQTGATGQFVRVNDGTTTAGVIVGTTALKTDMSSIAGTAPGATSFVPARLTDGSAYYSNTGQTAGTSVFSRINDGTTTAGVIVGTTALKTDMSSIVGAVPSATNPLPVRITDGAAFYSAASSAPTSPQFSTKTSAALGAGASVDLTHYVTSGKTGHLMGIDVASTVPLKVVINTEVTAAKTTRVVLFTLSGTPIQWRTPYKTFITRASADATSGFSVTITNKDASVAADVYSTGFWDEV